MIKLENLTYTYNIKTAQEKTAVNNVNLHIKEGELTGLIGATGSGKSTLIQHLNGLIKPTSGKVFIQGEDIWANPKNIRKFRFITGLVFQYPEYQLFEESVYKDIAYGPKNMGLNDDEIDKKVKMAAEFVGIKPQLLEKSPFDLSGGQKRRVAIAGIIAMDPKILVLDEPTAGLDPKGRDKILGQIKSYQKASKKTVVLISHSMEDIAKFAEKVVVMSKGEIFMHDTTENVFKNSEKLKEIGLDIPQITRIFIDLKQKGFNVNEGIFNVEQARDELLKIISK